MGGGSGVNRGGPAEPRARARWVAERHVLGGLVQRPELFGHRLTSGVVFREAVWPEDFLDPQQRRLSEFLWGRLGGGGGATLGGLLADLAYNQQHDLAALATDVDAEVESVCGERRDMLTALFEAGVELIVRGRTEREYLEKRRALLGGGSPVAGGEAAAQDEAALAQELMEYRRAHPSPTRILLWEK